MFFILIITIKNRRNYHKFVTKIEKALKKFERSIGLPVKKVRKYTKLLHPCSYCRRKKINYKGSTVTDDFVSGNNINKLF